MSIASATPFPGFAGTSPASGGRISALKARNNSSPVYGGGVRKADGGGRRKTGASKTTPAIAFIAFSPLVFVSACSEDKIGQAEIELCRDALSYAVGSGWYPAPLATREAKLISVDGNQCDFIFESSFGGLDIELSPDCSQITIGSTGCSITRVSYNDWSLKPELRMCSMSLYGPNESLSDIFGYEIESCPEDFSQYHYTSEAAR